MATGEKSQHSVATAFGNALRAVRGRVGLTQEALALEADFDRTYISLLERGQRQPTLQTIFELAAHLGVSPEELISLTRSYLPVNGSTG
ncbi:helix-turn-helix transcriptional regulator [Solimonas marina]|uniref:Helix-turn-helix transcriptional regulator n=1 Tax=Solimonas marina TaxID=2714601 RepID=A0A969WD75_9GAMM|nr:helix-turn-helix transcriptional regulator [Solimonas marina]